MLKKSHQHDESMHLSLGTSGQGVGAPDTLVFLVLSRSACSGRILVGLYRLEKYSAAIDNQLHTCDHPISSHTAI